MAGKVRSPLTKPRSQAAGRRTRDQEAASAAAFEDMMAATLGTFSAWGECRSQPALIQDSGKRNSE